MVPTLPMASRFQISDHEFDAVGFWCVGWVPLSCPTTIIAESCTVTCTPPRAIPLFHTHPHTCEVYHTHAHTAQSQSITYGSTATAPISPCFSSCQKSRLTTCLLPLKDIVESEVRELLQGQNSLIPVVVNCNGWMTGMISPPTKKGQCAGPVACIPVLALLSIPPFPA